jgi:hypothetical protein
MSFHVSKYNLKFWTFSNLNHFLTIKKKKGPPGMEIVFALFVTQFDRPKIKSILLFFTALLGNQVNDKDLASTE